MKNWYLPSAVCDVRLDRAKVRKTLAHPHSIETMLRPIEGPSHLKTVVFHSTDYHHASTQKKKTPLTTDDHQR